MNAENPLIAALDSADLGEIEHLAAVLGPHVGLLKVGLQAFIAHGARAVEVAAAHAPVFLDLKLHDIPNQVSGAARAAAEVGAAMLTVHASGGPDMVRAAVEAAPGVRVLAVTVLTSLDDSVLAAVGQPPARTQVPSLASLAVQAGAGGLVCAPTDIAAVRQAVGRQAALVVPGIRPADAARGDQARIGTPAEALAAGADYLVVGRPLTQAPDPAAAAQALLAGAAA